MYVPGSKECENDIKGVLDSDLHIIAYHTEKQYTLVLSVQIFL